jgi:hypothetical protein
MILAFATIGESAKSRVRPTIGFARALRWG